MNKLYSHIHSKFKGEFNVTLSKWELAKCIGTINQTLYLKGCYLYEENNHTDSN